jgi:hypothetical protein
MVSGDPEKSFLETGDGEGDKQGYLFRGQKGTFPDYNNFPGIKRGQSPVIPFFRGGEGDSTFNGFVLSNFRGSLPK